MTTTPQLLVTVQLAAATSTLVPSLGGYSHDLWAVVASGTAAVTTLQPQNAG